MDPFLKENLITTKDASELSGYTSDYLARLVRGGEITGKMIGHSWLIDSASLELFLSKQKSKKFDRARELAHARVQEYRTHVGSSKNISDTLTKRLPVASSTPLLVTSKIEVATGSSAESSLSALVRVPFRSHALALSVALAVVVSGATLARAAAVPQLMGQGVALATEIASGFTATFGDIPTHIASKIAATQSVLQEEVLRVASTNQIASAQLAAPLLVEPDLSSVRMALGDESHSRIALGGSASKSLSGAPAMHLLTRDDLQAFVVDAQQLLTSPQQMVGILTSSYAAVGTSGYALINASLADYRSLIEQSGAASLALAASTRDTLATTPALVDHMNLALGTAIIDAAHAAIHADVTLAYGTAAAAPATARATVALIGTTGNVLAGATSRVPALAVAAYVSATAVPAHLAPVLAQAVFGAEYAGASRFVALTEQATGGYSIAVTATGNLAYDLAMKVRLQQRVLKSDFNTIAIALAHTPAMLEDTYLGALGNTALALDTVAHTSPVAAVLVASTPAVSLGAQVASMTYQTIHSLFNSATSELAFLFSSTSLTTGAPTPLTTGTPTLVVAPVKKVAIVTPPSTGTATRVTQTVNSYPTYTTLVQGVSQDALQQALATARNNILSTVASMIQPVAQQGVTNMNTIQYVNMIQDLSNLIVRNGDFRGGIFDGGSVTNGIAVSATAGNFASLASTNATFGSLSVGATTFASTTISGELAANGAVSSGTSVTAPYFNAVSTTATSTFAGDFAVGTNQFLVQHSTGNVGIGTSSPFATLSLVGNGYVYGDFTATGNSLFTNATSTNFFATTASSTNLFAANAQFGSLGGAAVSSLTANYLPKWNNGTFSNSLISDTGTNVGIGTTSPATSLAVAGSGYFTGGFGVGVATTTPGVLQTSGNAWIGGNLTVIGNSTTLGASSADSLVINSAIKSNLTPDQNITYDLGSPSFFWKNIYVGNVIANNITANGTNIGGTNSATLTLNADNVSSDAENATLIFFRGNVVPNALLTWNAAAAAKRFEFNQPLSISNGTASTTQPLLSLTAVAGHTGTLFNIASSSGASLFSVDAQGNTTIGGNLISSGNLSLGNATSTNFFSTTASSTNLFAQAASVGTLAANLLSISGTSAFTGLTTHAAGFLSQASSTVAGNFTTTGTNTFGGALNLTGLATFANGYVSQASSTIVGNHTVTGNGLFGGTLTVNGNSLFTNATSTNFFATTASSTNLFAQSASVGTLAANSLTLGTALSVANGGMGTTTWITNSIPFFNGTNFTSSNANLNFTGSTLTAANFTSPGNISLGNATSTNLFSTTASSTNLFASNAQFGSLSVLGNTTYTGTLTQTGLATFANGFLSNASSTIISGLFSMNGGASTTQFTTTGSTYLATLGGNVGIGNTAPTYKLDVAGFINTDQYSGFKQAGNTVLYASTTNQSLAVGASSAAAWMAATSSLFYDVAVGQGALATAPTSGVAQFNTAVGVNTLSANTTGLANTANGYTSLQHNTTGSNNSGMGYYSLQANTTGSDNTAVGKGTLFSNTTGSNNTALGSNSGLGLTSGNNNLLLGKSVNSASYNQVTTGSNNISIGYDVAVASPTLSNQLNIGNLIYGTGLNGTGATISSGNVGIGTTGPVQKLDIVAASGTGLWNSDGLRIQDGAGGAVERQLSMGISTSGSTSSWGYGWIQSTYRGGGSTPIALNPQGSSVTIGSGISPNANSVLDITGNLRMRPTASTLGTTNKIFFGGNSSDSYRSSVMASIGSIQETANWYQNTGLVFNTYSGADGSGSDSTTEKMRITGAGNVGIGTTGPVNGLLQIAKDSAYGGSGTGGLFVGNKTTATKGIILGYDNTIATGGGYIQGVNVGTSWDNLLLNPNGGNVGIGTTVPGARLDISPTVTATTDLKGTLSGLVYNGASAMTNYYGHYIAAPTGTGTITNKYALVTEANAGNVGIGTTNPGALLSVGLNTTDSTVNGKVLVYGPSNNATPKTLLELSRNDSSGAYYGGGVGFNVKSNNAIVSNVNTTQFDITLRNVNSDNLATIAPVMSLQSNGNVGIGTTSPSQMLTVGNNNQFTVDSSGNVVGGAAGFGSVKVGNYSTYMAATGFYLNYAAAVQWTANSNSVSTADTGLSRLSAGVVSVDTGTVGNHLGTLIAGNVGIGTTTPATALDVNGVLSVGQNHIGQITLGDPYANSGGSYLSMVIAGGYVDFQSYGSTPIRFNNGGGGGIIFGTGVTFSSAISTTGYTVSGSGMALSSDTNHNYLNLAGGRPFVIDGQGAGGNTTIINTKTTVGLGLTYANTPTQTLTVFDNTVSTGATQLLVQGGAAAGDATTNQLFRINQGGGTTGLMVVQGNGNVGIGTTSPSALLSLGNGSGAAGTTAALGINFGDPAANLYRSAAGTIKTDGLLTAASGFSGGSSNQFSVSSTGAVSSTANFQAPLFSGTADNIGVTIQNRNFTNAGNPITLDIGTNSNSSGQINAVRITPTYNQTSTAGATDLLINRTETAVGSGPQLLFDAQVGGVSKFVINNLGNVGIGTTTINSKLVIQGSGITSSTAAETTYNASGTLLTTILNNGNVGIGTTSPSAKLDVWQTANGTGNVFDVSSTTAGDLLTVLGNGNVGIGYANPTNALQVNGNAYIGSTVGYNMLINSSGTIQTENATNKNTPLGLNTSGTGGINLGNATGVVYIPGNVGIGTTAPGAALDVASGRIRVTSAGSNPATGAGIEMYYTGAVGGVIAVDRATGLYKDLGFGVSNNQMYLKSNGDSYFGQGNVGIGVTTPSNYAGYTTLALASTTGAEIDFQTGASRKFGILNDATKLHFYNFNTSADAMTIDNVAGNVGIGTTVPGARLDISPTVTATTDLKGTLSGLVYNGASAMTNYYGHYIAAPTGTGTITNKYALVTEANAGNVGIGTTSPTSQLSVQASGSNVGLRVQGANGSNAQEWYSSAGIVRAAMSDAGALSINDGSKISLDLSGISYLQESGGLNMVSGASRDIIFSAGAGGERMRIKNDTGNVGIGTTVPGARLDISPTVTATTDLKGTLSGLVYNGASAMTNYYGHYIAAPTGTGTITNKYALVTEANAGNVGIGTTSPSAKLSIKGGGTTTGRNFVISDSSNAEKLTVLDNGSVGLGTTTPGFNLEVSGTMGIDTPTVSTTGDYLCWNTVTHEIEAGVTCTLSSEKFKTDIVPIQDGSLAEVLALKPVSFKFIPGYGDNGATTQLGFIAEQAETIDPRLVTHDATGAPNGFVYANYTSILTKAIQELYAQVQPLTAVLSIVPGADAQCVTGDTRLRRRKRSVAGGPDAEIDDLEFDEICIRDIVAGDYIQSLDERTGRVVYSRVNALMDMGEQEVFELVTRSGRRIRTTANHPYLARIAHQEA